MSEKNFRIRTDVGKDKVVNVQLTQDVDFLEILSLKLNQSDAYKLHVSDYGVIVGRVLANDSFGIPNAKISMFIELDDDDLNNSKITELYPFESISDSYSDGKRYNLLPDSSSDDCYRIVGNFPNKRLVLDNDTVLEIFDKYWKYTTVTNKSGDYMIFGVPSGNQTIHVDIDLSDIGILSQKPIDLMYKGYNSTQFDNARQFKEGTNLNNLSQILTQDNSVNVYPFWGDKSVEEIAISRCDIKVQYKFEPTCVFFGSIVTDNYNNSIGHKCTPSKHCGLNRNLVTGEGTIEMIRKTPDNLIEEFQIQGNRLIDGDGVWCYQIPMNLDYISTDEFGNIVPTDSEKNGIATRARVRFRVSMQETNNEGVSRHRAKYLIPNVQKVVNEGNSVYPYIENGADFENCYEFGSATPDEYFRDLYWNKVYSVKNYIPRIQTNGKKDTQNYSAIKTVNNNGNINPFPFNHARFKLVFAYRVLCMLMTIIITIISALNVFLSTIVCLKILWVRPFKFMCRFLSCISISGGLTEDMEDNVEFFPGCKRSCKCMMKCHEKGCDRRTDSDELINVVQQTLSQEYDTVNLDFYNDWVNGSLYLPLWFWKKTKKKKYFFGLFSKKAVNTFCNCSKHYSKLRVTQNCSLGYNGKTYSYDGDDNDSKYHHHFPKNEPYTYYGVIKEFENRDGLNIYYYAPGIPNTVDYKTNSNLNQYVRLYSTDIILLGSLSSCDIDNIPSVYDRLPSTTANVPYIATIKYNPDDESETGYVEITGMDWLHRGSKSKPKYGAGLLMDLACNAVYTKPKSCINVERMSELGVTLDTHDDVPTPTTSALKYIPREADGMITRYEIVDNESRALFASLNHNGLEEKVYNPLTGYYTYNLKYLYPNDFDGHLTSASGYTMMMKYKTYDVQDDNYIEYRFGGENKFFYSRENKGYSFPLFNNSYYFYFGLNEGKTAIDKFINRYHSACYKNEIFPFTINIKTNPSKWCYDIKKGMETDFATIDIELDGIKFPYSYTLYDEFNNEILSEEGMFNSNLKFGYDIIKGGGGYLTNNGKYVKCGRIKFYKSGEEVFNLDDENVYLINGRYKIKITDNNNNSIENVINIEQLPINVVYYSLGLDEKYYEGVTEKNDICNENSDKYGQITINYIVLDSVRRTIKDVNSPKDKNDKGYILTLDDDSKVYLLLTPLISDNEENNEELKDYDISDCTCNNNKDNYFFDSKTGSLQFRIWVPGNYELFVNQYCNKELNDNLFTTTINIPNGMPFNAFINEFPIKFILGRNEAYTSYNKHFWNGTSGLTDGWKHLNDESIYSFPSINIANESIWADFVDTIIDTSINHFDKTTIDDIILYKYNCIFNLCSGSYILGDYDNDMYISHKGGRGPILFKGCYPQYDDADDGAINNIIHDNIGVVSCENSFPNVISMNYCTYDNDESMPQPLQDGNYVLNSLITMDVHGSQWQGNYFAAFTNNGGFPKSSDITYEDKNKDGLVDGRKFSSIPYLARPNVKEEKDLFKTYFKGQFVDKRLDYSFFIITPYSGNDVKFLENTSDNSSEWKNGRISGTTFNGVEMSYDNQFNYNIIGSGLEYNTTIDYENKNINANKVELIHDSNIGRRKFYSAYLKCDSKKYPIEGFFHGTSKTLNGLSSNTFSKVTQNVNSYPMVRGFDIINIPQCNKIEFSCTSCSYKCDVGIEEKMDSNNNVISFVTGSTEPSNETSFKVSCRSVIQNQLDSLMECAGTDSYNIRFDGGEMSKGKTSKFESKYFEIKFHLKGDTSNDTHLHYSSLPRPVNMLGYGKTPKNIMTKIKELRSIDEIIKELKSNTNTIGGRCEYESEVGVKAPDSSMGYGLKEFKIENGNAVSIGGKSMSDKLAGQKDGFEHFEYDGRLVYDNDTEFKNLLFKKNFRINKNEKIIGFYFMRNYINSSDDNLTKEICTIQFTSIYDARDFKLKCTDIGIRNDITLDPPPEPTPPEESGGTKTVAEGETDPTPEPLPSPDEVQYVQYEMVFEKSTTVNQEFENTDNISCVIKVDNKISNHVILKTDEKKTKLIIDTYWGGDLKDTRLDDGKNVNLYMKMPNQLIYLLKFKQNGK